MLVSRLKTKPIRDVKTKIPPKFLENQHAKDDAGHPDIGF